MSTEWLGRKLQRCGPKTELPPTKGAKLMHIDGLGGVILASLGVGVVAVIVALLLSNILLVLGADLVGAFLSLSLLGGALRHPHERHPKRRP